ncbi:ABC transporter ATP-binding protein [Anthocerotibacter panamensis]|uniref:ABC transporter ATP-binding protein n=1 Tax=Anthocerotibacter panamensis TaxID=2857077 RepID=UPI001C40637D|nr:ATP-binding cassette domain-containing protein [Anthocerotibacter panamensis]
MPFAPLSPQAHPERTRPIIQLKGIHKRFGDKVVLDGVDFELYDGEAVAIVGPSGTGKSTILRIMCGLLEPDEGEVIVDGKNAEGALSNGDKLGVRIGMVFQQAALFDSLTVEENVGFLLYQKSRLPRTKIRELVTHTLSRVGLNDIESLYPASLSGGQRKRVSFARAIMEDPSYQDSRHQIILYDEPTAGLDPIASTVIEDLIQDLRVGGTVNGYVVVTHQESTIRRTADRILLLHQGKSRWSGAVSEIDSVDNPYVRQFFAGSTQGPIH